MNAIGHFSFSEWWILQRKANGLQLVLIKCFFSSPFFSLPISIHTSDRQTDELDNTQSSKCNFRNSKCSFERRSNYQIESPPNLDSFRIELWQFVSYLSFITMIFELFCGQICAIVEPCECERNGNALVPSLRKTTKKSANKTKYFVPQIR